MCLERVNAQHFLESWSLQLRNDTQMLPKSRVFFFIVASIIVYALLFKVILGKDYIHGYPSIYKSLGVNQTCESAMLSFPEGATSIANDWSSTSVRESNAYLEPFILFIYFYSNFCASLHLRTVVITLTSWWWLALSKSIAVARAGQEGGYVLLKHGLDILITTEKEAEGSGTCWSRDTKELMMFCFARCWPEGEWSPRRHHH